MVGDHKHVNVEHRHHGSSSDSNSLRRPSIKLWTGYAACAWAILFVAPHVWWALGFSAAFPGGDKPYEFGFQNSWFLAYDLVVVILLIASASVALALVQERWRRLFFFPSRHRRMVVAASWVACTILIARGLIGFVVYGQADLTFFGWPTFLAGGILFGATAWSYTRRPSPSLASHHDSSNYLGK
jgi:hypothetical protein